MNELIQVARKSPKVFVIEQQPFDYTPATVYGELVFMDSERLAPSAPNAPDTWNKTVLHSLRREISSYIPGYDYIVPTGAPSRMLVVGMLLAEKGRSHKMLGWDNRQRRYLEYVINL